MTKPIVLILKDLVRITETNSPLHPIGYSFPYAGTQFGDYNSDMGDGRSALVRWSVQKSLPNVKFFKGIEFILKGNMTTAFTPKGLDGKLELSSFKNTHYTSKKLLTESLPTELFHFRTDNVEDVQIQLMRPTILRVGTFQYLKQYRPDLIRPCLDHLLSRMEHTTVTDMFRSIVIGYRDMADRWEKIGFVHGCLNTDNVCAIPCAIDLGWSFFTTDKDKSSPIDLQGRYSLRNQKQALLDAMLLFWKAVETELHLYSFDDLQDDWWNLK